MPKSGVKQLRKSSTKGTLAQRVILRAPLRVPLRVLSIGFREYRV